MCWCHPTQWIDPYFMNSVLHTVLADQNGRRLVGEYRGKASGPRIASNRNELVKEWLEQSDAPWMLMVDADMVFTCGEVYQIYDAAAKFDVKIVGGLCCSVDDRGGTRSTALVEKADGAGRVALEPFEEVRGPLPENALVEVTASGAAFLLVHREVCVKIKEYIDSMPDDDPTLGPSKAYPWFGEAGVGEGSVGEDVYFCLQALGLGYKSYVATNVKIGHRKPFVFGL